jgi:hypothetical protein
MPATRGATNPLVQELERVHDTLRRDLRTCQNLADAVRTGAGPADASLFPVVRRQP